MEDLEAMKDILDRFGAISDLKTNINKCSATPIQCAPEDIDIVRGSMPCAIADFPCTYLGLPLSITKLTKAALQPLVDRVADQLPCWKAALIHPAGRTVLVKAVLMAIPIYHLMVLDILKRD